MIYGLGVLGAVMLVGVRLAGAAAPPSRSSR